MKKKKAPCGSCDYGPHKAPELMPENIEALELWNQVNTQWRAGAMGMIGLDYSEVRTRARELDIDLSECVWRKIKALEGKILDKQYKTENE
jgi:hypothetical protein